MPEVTGELPSWVTAGSHTVRCHRARRYDRLWYSSTGPLWRVANVSVVIVRFEDDESYWIVPDSDVNNPEIGPYDTLEAALVTLKLLKE